MYYLFSNVMRPKEPSEYSDRFEKVARPDESEDIMVFMNACAPLLKCSSFFCRFNLMIVGRIDSLHGGIMWTLDDFSRATSLPCRSKTVRFIDDDGNISEENGTIVSAVRPEVSYPGVNPTTGYMMYRWLSMNAIKDISLVNFYGENDKSTPMWEGHDYSYENNVLRMTAKMIFLEE